MTYNKILENLYLGDQADASHFDQDFPDGHIIVVLEERPRLEPFKSMHIPVLTSSSHVHSTQLNKIACVINAILGQGKPLLVHCAAGVERSPLTVAWYLHKYQNVSMDGAYEIIKRLRPQIADRQQWLTIDK